MGMEDRTRRARETLIFDSPEKAEQFSRGIENRIQKQAYSEISRPREVVAQELAKQFEQEGYGISPLAHPWEHSEAEHQEAQRLVDMAFHQDLASALSSAEKSSLFPRNIDLFHDLLTGELYNAFTANRSKSHYIPLVLIGLVALFFVLLLGAILVFVYSL